MLNENTKQKYTHSTYALEGPTTISHIPTKT